MRAFAIFSTLLVTLSAKAQTYDILDFYPHEDGLSWTYEGTITAASNGISVSVAMTFEVEQRSGVSSSGEPILIESTHAKGVATGNGKTINTESSSETWKSIENDGIYNIFHSDDDDPEGTAFIPGKSEYPRLITIGQQFTSQGVSQDSMYTPEGPISININGNTYETLAIGIASGAGTGTAYMLRDFGIIAIDIEAISDNGVRFAGRLELVSSSKPLTPKPTNWLWDGTFNMSNGWRWSDWFGLFFESESGWVYDLSEGWLFPAAPTQDSVWLYSINRNDWMWTADEIAPFFWTADDNNWIWSPRE